MNLLQGMRWVNVTGGSASVAQVSSRAASTSVSATINCAGFDRVRIWAQQNKYGVGAKACKIIFKVGTHTASSLFSSGVHTLVHAGQSAAALSATRALAYDVALDGVGPYVTALLSTLTASGVTGIQAIAYNGKYNPLGTAVGTNGFTSITFVPAQP